MADDAVTIQRKVLENTYLRATRSLVFLADGYEPPLGIKLEDKDFQAISKKAATRHPGPTAVLLSTLTYTFFQLKFAYQWPWESIEFRPEAEAYENLG